MPITAPCVVIDAVDGRCTTRSWVASGRATCRHAALSWRWAARRCRASPPQHHQAVLAKWRPDPDVAGFGAELRSAFATRLRWLEKRQLVAPTDGADELFPKPDMMRSLRQFETQRLVASLSRELRAAYVPHEVGTRINGIYERPIVTPTGRLALIRREDTFTLAPWKPALEPLRGRAVTGVVGPTRVTWTIDRARPARTVAGQC